MLLVGHRFNFTSRIDAPAQMLGNNQVGIVLIKAQSAIAARWLPFDQCMSELSSRHELSIPSGVTTVLSQ